MERGRTRLMVGACLAAAVVSLWLRAGLPLVAVGGSSLDDGLFLEQAQSLFHAHWLGDFDHRTLAKGMFYPLFIALSFAAAVPLKVAEQLVYMAVSGGFAWMLARRTSRPVLGAALFVALAFNPIMWVPFMARVVREGLYISLSLLVVALTARALWGLLDGESLRRRLGWAAASGLALGCFWLTREEGPWLLPSLAVLVLGAGLALFDGTSAGSRPPRKQALLALGATMLLPMAAAFALTVGCVKTVNYWRYGVFETNEFHSHSFRRAYGALARIEQDRWQRYVVISSDARRQAYQHSAAARELQPFFEGPDGARWRAIGCTQLQIADCPEIHAGWFMWALREAVASKGFYRSAPQALAFYDRLADEIDAACDAGQLRCLPARATLAPPFRWHYLKDALTPSRGLLTYLFGMGRREIDPGPSSGTPQQIAQFRDFTGGWTLPPPLLGGWIAAAPGSKVEVALNNLLGQPAHDEMVRSAAPDVEKAWPGLKAQRFKLATGCAPADCLLHVRAGERTLDLPLRAGFLVNESALKVYLESLAVDGSSPLEQRRRVQDKLMRPLAAAYAWSMPVLSVLALAGVAAAAWRPRVRRAHAMPLLLAVASLVAVLARAGLLAYLDVTSIPSANGSYTTPASPFVLVFALLGLWLGRLALDDTRRTPRPPPVPHD